MPIPPRCSQFRSDRNNWRPSILSSSLSWSSLGYSGMFKTAYWRPSEIKSWTSGEIWPESQPYPWLCTAGRNLCLSSNHDSSLSGSSMKKPLLQLHPVNWEFQGHWHCWKRWLQQLGTWYPKMVCFWELVLSLPPWPNSITTIICKILTLWGGKVVLRLSGLCQDGVYFFEDWVEATWWIRMIRSLFFSSFDFGIAVSI